MIVLVGIIVLHIVLYWGVKSGFVGRAIDAVAPPIETKIIEEKVKDDTPPPPPPPEMKQPPVEVPPPVIDITIPIDAPTSTALTNTTTERVAPPPVVVAPVVRTVLKQSKAAQPDIQDYYPPTSIRLGEEGVVRLKVCVNPAGRVETSVVEATSNFARLDEAGVKVSKVMRFVPPTENGKPVGGCGSLPIRFKIKND